MNKIEQVKQWTCDNLTASEAFAIVVSQDQLVSIQWHLFDAMDDCPLNINTDEGLDAADELVDWLTARFENGE